MILRPLTRWSVPGIVLVAMLGMLCVFAGKAAPDCDAEQDTPVALWQGLDAIAAPEQSVRVPLRDRTLPLPRLAPAVPAGRQVVSEIFRPPIG